MSASDPVSDPEILLEHLDWVRDLARRLVRDPSEADDLSQEAWLAARSGLPAGAISVRGWLARVVRNLARQQGRREARRRELESLAARSESVPGTLDVVAEVSLQKRVVEAVLELREPYRRTLLARYYERCSPAEIARSEGVTVAAVKARLHRGLAELRRKLEGRFDDELAVVLAPLCLRGTRAAGWSATASGALTVAAAASVVLLVLVAHGVQRRAGADGLLVGYEPRQTGAGPAAQSAAAPTDTRVSAGRRGPATDDRTTAAASEPAAVRGRVLDVEGAPLSGVALRVVHSGRSEKETLEPSGPDGAFELPPPPALARVALDDPRYTAVYEPYVLARDPDERVLVAAPPCPVEGRVTDTTGRRVDGAKVTFELTEEVQRGLEGVLGRGVLKSFSASTDPEGRFVLDAPCAPGRLVVGSYGHQVLRRALGEDRAGLELVIAPLAPERRVVYGRVADAEGYPVYDAYVTAGGRAVSTDGCGRFQLSLDPDGAPVELVAAAPGRRPARALYDAPFTGRIDFELHGEPHSVEGVVVDLEGRAVAGALVRALDATDFGNVLNTRGGVERFERIALEALLRGSRSPWVEADDRGRFALGGLEPRAYRLLALDPATQVRGTSPPVDAGSRGVSITIGCHAVAPVAGVVVDDLGRPVAGAQVRSVLAPGSEPIDEETFGPFTATDHEGRFALGHQHVAGLALELRGPDGFMIMRGRLDKDRAPHEQLLVLPRSSFLRVELSEPGAADTLTLEDGDGARLFLVRYSGLQPSLFISGALDRAGRSALYEVPCTARNLLLSKGGVVVARHPIELEPGSKRRIQL